MVAILPVGQSMVTLLLTFNHTLFLHIQSNFLKLLTWWQEQHLFLNTGYCGKHSEQALVLSKAWSLRQPAD